MGNLELYLSRVAAPTSWKEFLHCKHARRNGKRDVKKKSVGAASESPPWPRKRQADTDYRFSGQLHAEDRVSVSGPSVHLQALQQGHPRKVNTADLSPSRAESGKQT